MATDAGQAVYKFDHGYPTPDTTLRARNDAELQRATVAYRFWYPAVSNEGIFNGNRAVGINDNEAIGIAACGPRQVGFTLNSDTPYGSGCLDVSKGPMVIELPPGPYIGLIDDHYQGWVLDMGLPGPDAGKGGKHLVLPPGYRGETASGYHVGRSNSMKNLLAVRALPAGGDVAKALDALRAIKVYPLTNPGKPVPCVDTTEKENGQLLSDLGVESPVLAKASRDYQLGAFGLRISAHVRAALGARYRERQRVSFRRPEKGPSGTSGHSRAGPIAGVRVRQCSPGSSELAG